MEEADPRGRPLPRRGDRRAEPPRRHASPGADARRRVDPRPPRGARLPRRRAAHRRRRSKGLEPRDRDPGKEGPFRDRHRLGPARHAPGLAGSEQQCERRGGAPSAGRAAPGGRPRSDRPARLLHDGGGPVVRDGGHGKPSLRAPLARARRGHPRHDVARLDRLLPPRAGKPAAPVPVLVDLPGPRGLPRLHRQPQLAQRRDRRRRGASTRAAASPSRPGFRRSGSTGATWSDHASFWKFGYPAIQVTDTGGFRSPFHTGPGDTPEKLDYRALARIALGMYGSILELSTLER